MKRRFLAIIVTVAILALASTAYALPITPTFTTFGTLAGATWGGTDLPNDPVAITTIIAGQDTITLGLIAHARYYNPAVGDNNAGIYYATPGLNNGLPPSPSSLMGATWNFGSYVSVSGTGSYNFQLLYDFDPLAGTSVANHGTINFAVSGGQTVQGSENLNFGWLSNPIPGVVTPPPFTFNAYASGEYTFSLRAYEVTGRPLGESAIQVNVVPDGGMTLTLLGCALAGLGALRRKLRA